MKLYLFGRQRLRLAMRAVCARATREIFILNTRLLWLCKAERCDADAGVGRILRKQMGNHDARR
jgi:hypothetical protein